MHRLALLALLALLPVTPAHADGSAYIGDCSFHAMSHDDVTGHDRFVGEAHAAIALRADGPGNVVNATVSCDLRVNGVLEDSISQWGSGVVVLAGQMSYTASETDVVTLCVVVDYTSDDTPTENDCYHTSYWQFPPQWFINLLNSDLTGAGYNTGTAGLQVVTQYDVTAACSYATDPATGTITVLGGTATTAAGSSRIRCRLTDTATGAVLYDDSVTAATSAAYLHAAVSANPGPVTVCAEGAGDDVVAALYCRPGEPLDRLVP